MDAELLRQLTEKLGGNASELFRLAIRQNYFFVAWDWAVIVFLAVLGLVINKKMVSKDDCDELNWIKYVILIVIAVLIFVLLGTSTYRLVNPQYQAFYDIMGAFRSN